MPDRLHLRIPLQRLERELTWLADQQLHPEVALSGSELDQLDTALLDRLHRRMNAAGLAPLVHAPFHDLNPGALEQLVADVTRHRLEQTLDVAAALGARLVVVHPGYEFWKYGGQAHLWVEQSLRFWPPLIRRAQQLGTRLAVENIFDTAPEPLATLLDRIDNANFGHCFDVGHWHLFSRMSLENWFNRLGSRLLHLHLHDNSGQRDEHLVPGEGRIDFQALALAVAATGQRPSLTFEIPPEQGSAAFLRELAQPFLKPRPPT